MSYVNTVTMIPLARVAQILQTDPYHFFSVYTSKRPFRFACPDDWYQHDWQEAGKLSRENMASALRQAEDAVVKELCWAPIPQWFEEEHAIQNYYKPEVTGLYNSRGRLKSVTTNFGHVTEFGQRASTFIDTPATTFHDYDADGFDETAEITFNTTVTAADELHVYYPDKNGRPEWEIRPISYIDITAGVATVRFPKYLAGLEALIERPIDPDQPHIGLDGDDNTQFLATVDVYRVYSDPAVQATFYFEDDLDCSSGDCEPATATGCLQARDRRLGVVAYKPATYDTDTATYADSYFCQEPDKIKIYYRAGWQDIANEYPNRQMDAALERLIIYYALSLLDTKLHGCDNTMDIWKKQTTDMAMITDDVRYVVPWALLGNPFGTSRAAIQLWKHIQPIRLAKSPRA